jgi:hypothetical protein
VNTQPPSEAAERLEFTLLPTLDAAAARLRSEFPKLRIRAEAHPIGSRTALQGHMAAISCLMPDVVSEEDADLVDLVVQIQHLTTQPELSGLYVCWGHPSGRVEIDLLPAPVPLDATGWQLVEQSVPVLIEALRNALRRGRPPPDFGEDAARGS